jgi:hypothetical protein
VNIPVNPIIDSTYGMSMACSTHGEKMKAYRALVGKPEGKETTKKTRHMWKDNNKMDLR